jgi:DNA helicase II / ATP-dependent DNA helicase PcrA
MPRQLSNNKTHPPMMPTEETLPQYLASLNEQQLAAVRYVDGPSLIVAGAGSGKTTVLTSKIAYLISSGMMPYNILALTFTNKAAREMRQRIEMVVGATKARNLWMGTFHSVFSRILRKEAHVFGFTSNYTIYQPSDTASLLKAIAKERGLDDKVYKPSLLAGRISEAKNRLYAPLKYCESKELAERDRINQIPAMGEIYSEYFRRCHAANAMDFDDLLLFTYVLFECYPEVKEKYAQKFHHILVDEYQDTNFAQSAILKQLAGKNLKISVVGDDAQSIYGFRGALIDNILKFEKEYKGTRVFRLERNYRSTQNIVNAANSLIKKNKFRLEKDIYSENEVGSPIVLTGLTSDIEEGETICRKVKALHDQGIEYSDMAVLYRTNGQSRILEETMRKRGVPCVIYGGISFYDRKEIRDVLAYLRLAANQHDEEALRRVINRPARGIGNTTIDKVFKCAIENEVAPWQVVQQPDRYGLAANKGTKSKLAVFAQLIERFKTEAQSLDASQMGHLILKESGLMASAQTDLTGEGREVIDNYSSLLSGMSQFVDSQREEGNEDAVSLADYMSNIALLTDADKDVEDGNSVSLMTVHSSKGLEFDVVFVTGMEQEIFPGVGNSYSETDLKVEKEIEEERRLLFVAITRAKKLCFLSYAKIRFRFGKSDYYEPSQFLNDIDSRYVKRETSSLVSMRTSNFDRRSDKVRKTFFDYGERTVHTTAQRSNTYGDGSPRRLIRIRPATGIEPSSCGNMAVGRTVEHATFGIGIVKAVENGAAGWTAVIAFENFGEKKLLLKYAKLKVL